MVYAEVLIEKFRRRGLVFDSNLLLLYLVGLHDRSLIGDGKYNNLSKYTSEDFNILVRFRGLFSRAVTTPHVLTELSNLANDFPQAIKIKCFASFQKTFAQLNEISVSSLQASRRLEFNFLGLTDCVLAELTPDFLMVSDDARLVNKLGLSGPQCLNFNHLRGYLLVR